VLHRRRLKPHNQSNPVYKKLDWIKYCIQIHPKILSFLLPKIYLIQTVNAPTMNW